MSSALPITGYPTINASPRGAQPGAFQSFSRASSYNGSPTNVNAYGNTSPALMAPSAAPMPGIPPLANTAAASYPRPFPTPSFIAPNASPAIPSFTTYPTGGVPTKPDNKAVKTPMTASKRLEHVGKAALFLLTLLLLKHFPGRTTQLHSTLLTPNWKEWAKVGLGIASMSQATQAMNWKPPLWLNAMMNVAIVSPLVAGFTRQNVIQGVLLAPVVGGMAEGAHYLSDKSEKTLQEKLNIPPIFTQAIFSVLTVLLGLKIFPWFNNAIPKTAAVQDSAAMRAGMVSSCVNGCCASLICINDIGQLGTALFRSITDRQAERKPSA